MVGTSTHSGRWAISVTILLVFVSLQSPAHAASPGLTAYAPYFRPVSSEGLAAQPALEPPPPDSVPPEYQLYDNNPKLGFTIQSTSCASTNGPHNNRLAVRVCNVDARYNMGAFPNSSGGAITGESWNMMYDWPANPWSSYFALAIDGYAYLSDNYYGVTLEEANDINSTTNRSVWQTGDIKVTQLLELVVNETTGERDVLKVSYIVENVGTASHTVGGRILIDTMVADNDGAPYVVPGVGLVDHEIEFVGSNIPTLFYSAYGEGIAQSAPYNAGTPTPSRMVMAYWEYLYNYYYFTVNPNRTFNPAGYPDSAYAVYWDPSSLAVGASRTYVTYYGITASLPDGYRIETSQPKSGTGDERTCLILCTPDDASYSEIGRAH